MKIEQVPIDSLSKYDNNSKVHTESQIEKLMESITKFGVTRPIGIWKNTIVYGHGTIEALKRLGRKEVDVVRLDYMTDEERKAYTHLDNMIGEETKTDLELAIEDLLDFEFDIEIDLDTSEDKPKEREYYGDERERTSNAYNLLEAHGIELAGKYEIPKLKPVDYIPNDLISFNYMLNTKQYDKGIHFFIDDYQFERIWSKPEFYLDKIAEYDCMLTPDFSLYQEMPQPLCLYNVYRSRLIGALAQQRGITVIPTLQWRDKSSYDYCFDGLKGGVVAVSTIGVKKGEAYDIFCDGMDEAIKRIDPQCVIVYGGDVGYNYPCDVKYFTNHNSENFNK